jgi:hypothetical protein
LPDKCENMLISLAGTQVNCHEDSLDAISLPNMSTDNPQQTGSNNGRTINFSNNESLCLKMSPFGSQTGSIDLALHPMTTSSYPRKAKVSGEL